MQVVALCLLVASVKVEPRGWQGLSPRTRARRGNGKIPAGQMQNKPAAIIDAWMRSPDGCSPDDSTLMYSTSTAFMEIKSVRAALTSFAAQIVLKEIVREVEDAIKPENGLHVSMKGKMNSLCWRHHKQCRILWKHPIIQSKARVVRQCASHEHELYEVEAVENWADAVQLVTVRLVWEIESQGTKLKSQELATTGEEKGQGCYECYGSSIIADLPFLVTVRFPFSS
ncbi:hypothetical protein FIBSPDRAFT_883643 [Athelia psychrophila]|uniref:Uncharacterized protein n=1 Tax=Athelia psychrophila TaxID=1759441 RepID=A0A166TS58_9AGAM|nr:hypothetical protein FIBSPDRAFT_883643 [Fibularhizoctonia sp. CBS 109695]